jgi:hypothetical protein
MSEDNIVGAKAKALAGGFAFGEGFFNGLKIDAVMDDRGFSGGFGEGVKILSHSLADGEDAGRIFDMIVTNQTGAKAKTGMDKDGYGREAGRKDTTEKGAP